MQRLRSCFHYQSEAQACFSRAANTHPTSHIPLVKKEMRVLRAVTHGDPDAAELLDVARTTARQRVVVKRPRVAEPLRNDVSLSILSENTRFDVYVTKLKSGQTG